ncbi:MAG: hypothetical protein CVU51_09315 [Deltaproteobacteria bacterium HGW-Deltaproteobacteria-1]|nr:MAG: hypothetical protein CVU51_09315 [Deltaproteobacteria bacterium HGW-Deltaproteobacteria-1]
MEYKNIIVSTKDFVTTIILNRPPMNSVNLGIREELFNAVNEIETSRDTRAVIITGAGEKGFSAGMDVSDIANITKGPGSQSRDHPRLGRYSPATQGCGKIQGAGHYSFQQEAVRTRSIGNRPRG